MFWGYSPALDLLQRYKSKNSLEGKTELNILIVGSADVRHVLKTISKFYTHEDAQNVVINFYIVDVLLEFTAREMLLTLIALEPSDKLALKEKTNLWMEIFGNTFLRPTSAEYLIKKSYQFIKMITNKDYLRRRMPCFNFDYLKYKEKDRLETIFKFWVDNNVNLATNWDNRLRKELGTRYDSKSGVFDWDYYSKLKELKDGDLVNSREYIQWRGTGLAFTWLEKGYSVSNATFALGIDSEGDKLFSIDKIYLGDIVSGPYFCFGIECEDESMLKITNTSRIKRATDITERNLMRMFYEIEHNSKYEHIGDERNLGLVVTELAKLNFEHTKIHVDCENFEDDYTALPIKHKLIFLPTNTLQDPAKFVRFANFFDMMYIAQGLLTKVNTSVLGMVKDDGPIIMETRKFLLISKKEHEKFKEDVVNLMNEGNRVEVGANDFMNDTHVTFIVKIPQA